MNEPPFSREAIGSNFGPTPSVFSEGRAWAFCRCEVAPIQRKELEAELELGALHLAETEILLGKQEALIAHLESYGTDTSAARQFLEQQRDLLRQHQADWDRLNAEREELEKQAPLTLSSAGKEYGEDISDSPIQSPGSRGRF
jgi:hypothetical protein